MAISGFLKRDQLQQLIDVLRRQGYNCLGPQVKDNTIVYDGLEHVSQLPQGIEVRQSPGKYRLQQKSHLRNFSWANTAQAIKPVTFAAHEVLWHCRQDENGNLNFDQCSAQQRPLAIIGVRACDLSALELQKKHFLNPYAEDPWFKQRYESLLIIAVNCSHSADTCFCHVTGDGPSVKGGFDIALHELDDGFCLTTGTKKGEAVASELPLEDLLDKHEKAAVIQIKRCIESQQLTLPENVKDKLLAQLENPYWEEIGKRCLSCGNCTAVCPTCFCHQQRDELSFADNTGAHYRQWSSCFSHNHGYISGYSFRPTSSKRYRQWLTHKFANWYDQYGRSGCVGCGRCINWCPVGIDVTHELKVLCEDQP